MTAAREFDAGVASIEALIAAEHADAAIDPRCVSTLLTHGAPTERAVVLFHGFTNCPRQFAQLADLLFAQGFNVYIPRLPRHGLLDKYTTALEALTVDELTAAASAAINVARQLGAGVNALGISVGATLVAWVAQTQRIDRAVAIAPFFSVARVPSVIEPALRAVLGRAPNLELWWDPRAKGSVGPPHGYPRFATHALARCLQLGEIVHDLARSAAPLAAFCRLVLNAKDPAIDNGAARAVWKLWRDRGAAADEYIFENLDTRHDIVEPQTYSRAAELVYPVLGRLLQQ